MLYVGNAFSLSMVKCFPTVVTVKEVGLEEVRNMLEEEFVSCVGHESTARVLSVILGKEIPCNRVAVTLETGDRLVVFQVLQRLEEGRVLSCEEIKAVPFKLLLVEIGQGGNSHGESER